MKSFDRIHELNRQRAEAQQIVDILKYANTPVDPENKVAADARFRLAWDAWQRAEVEYSTAIATLSTDELIALAKEAQ